MEAQIPANNNNLTELEQKHWPQIELINPKIGEKFVVKVKVGIITHPMTVEHQIVYIELFCGSKPIGKVFLSPDQKPEAEFTVFTDKKEELIAYEFCNLHGLWKNSIKF